VIIYSAPFKCELDAMSSPIHNRIEDNLKEILPLAQKADEILTELKLDNKGRFSAIFSSTTLFKVKSTLFLPYLEEVSNDLQTLPQPQEAGFETLLTDLLKKIELLHQLLGSFHEIQDDKDSQK
jgi:primosomal protein N''